MLQTRLEVAIVGIAAAWGILSALSRLLRRRQLGRWPVRYRIIQPGRLSSLNASEGRRSAVLNHLRRFSDENGVPLEFIERPPGLEDIRLREYGRQDPVRYWLASRLALQLERDENLLLERVTDAFVCLERLQRITPDEFPYLIRLERLGSAEWNDDAFPWKVVVCCDEPLQLAEHFGDPAIQTWLGIGVDFISQKRPSARISREAPPEASPPTAAVAQGRCRIGGDGLEGTVGGILEDATQTLGITARHVLSTGFGSVAWPTGSMPAAAEFTQDSPDVAFIRLDSGCFPEAIGSAMLDVLPGCQADLERAVWTDTKYRKAPLRDKIGWSGHHGGLERVQTREALLPWTTFSDDAGLCKPDGDHLPALKAVLQTWRFRSMGL
jgi:hypothetical protein